MTNPQPLAVSWTNWDREERCEINTWEESDAMIKRATSQEETPFLIEFFSPDSGQSLGLGIGRELTVVTYQDSLDPPYFISLGNKESFGTEWFCYGKEQTEYLARNLVPMNQGLAALKHFVLSRTQPGNLVWERL
jgi:Immunity protein Imm1